MSAERIPELLASLERDSFPVARELVRAILELHGQALSALMQIVASEPALLERVARDERVLGVLLLHGLHPLPPEQRVREALRGFPEVTIHSLQVVGGRLHARIECARTAPGSGLRERLQQAVAGAVPDLSGFRIEGLPRAPLAIPVVIEPS